MPSPSFGITLPAARTAGSYFAPSDALEAAWSKVLIAVLTPVGSRFNKRDFGCAVADNLFGFLDAATEEMVRYHITTAITRHVPEVSVTDIVISRSQRYSLRASVRMTVKLSGETLERDLILSSNT